MFVEAAFSGARKVRKAGKTGKTVKNASFLLFLLVCVSFFAAGCPTSPTAVPNENMRETVHKNGLTVRLPEKFAAAEIGEGFRIEPADGSNKNVRYPVEATVTLEADPPAGEFPREKTDGGRSVKYRVEKQDGGSGGEEYSLTAIETVAGGYIVYRQREQSKTVEPNFDLTRTIIAGTSYKK